MAHVLPTANFAIHLLIEARKMLPQPPQNALQGLLELREFYKEQMAIAEAHLKNAKKQIQNIDTLLKDIQNDTKE